MQPDPFERIYTVTDQLLPFMLSGAVFLMFVAFAVYTIFGSVEGSKMEKAHDEEILANRLAEADARVALDAAIDAAMLMLEIDRASGASGDVQEAIERFRKAREANLAVMVALQDDNSRQKVIGPEAIRAEVATLRAQGAAWRPFTS